MKLPQVTLQDLHYTTTSISSFCDLRGAVRSNYFLFTKTSILIMALLYQIDTQNRAASPDSQVSFPQLSKSQGVAACGAPARYAFSDGQNWRL